MGHANNLPQSPHLFPITIVKDYCQIVAWLVFLPSQPLDYCPAFPLKKTPMYKKNKKKTKKLPVEYDLFLYWTSNTKLKVS